MKLDLKYGISFVNSRFVVANQGFLVMFLQIYNFTRCVNFIQSILSENVFTKMICSKLSYMSVYGNYKLTSNIYIFNAKFLSYDELENIFRRQFSHKNAVFSRFFPNFL